MPTEFTKTQQIASKVSKIPGVTLPDPLQLGLSPQTKRCKKWEGKWEEGDGEKRKIKGKGKQRKEEGKGTIGQLPPATEGTRGSENNSKQYKH